MKTYSLFALLLTAAVGTQAQSQLYPQHFDLHEVTLTDGPLKTAMDTNIRLLLQYDADRLLTPYVRQAGLKTGKYAGWESAHPNFNNWGSGNFRLDGHVGGHYVSALALAYAASHDEAQRVQLKERLDYMVDVMKDCQDAFASNTDGMKGYIGGQPVNDIWPALYRGDVGPFNNCGGWVTFYCEHKILAGLRDAYVYAGSEKAKECYLALCDWAVNVISKLSDDQMQALLGWEHGGMNEAVADAYALTGDTKYLDGARRYSHRQMVDGMQGSTATYNQSFLDGKHANTQVPKYIGFERINQLQADEKFRVAAENFWDDVAMHRTVCIGGNSIGEHFLAKANAIRYIESSEGPESCNTNNMLKLSEMLFDRTHEGQYADFYEASMWNHILSTQDPQTGGYVYFTSLRPQSYRIYSQVNQGMWCCVGTGMENHSKYGHFIYTHDEDKTLYVNLFVASTLDNGTFGLKQETAFPFDGKTQITVTKDGTYTMAIRRPSWTTSGYSVKVNGQDVTAGTASYVTINRPWKKGDVVSVEIPMALTLEECPGLPSYVAFKYGPLLLAATTGTEDMKGEYAGEGRMDHSLGAVGVSKTISSSPLIIAERQAVLPGVKVKDAASLTFEMPVRWKGENTTIELTPFHNIHHARYSCYFWQGTEQDYADSDMGKRDAEEQAIIARTLDYVATGEQQSEAGHEVKYGNSSYGQYRGETYRDAQAGGFIQYELATKGETEAIALMCRYITADKGRKCRILVDGVQLTDVEIPASATGADENGFYNIEFPIPSEMLAGKQAITVRFEANQGTLMPGLYYLRLVNGWADRTKYSFKCADWVTGDANRVAQSAITYNTEDNVISVAATGDNNVCLMLNTSCGYEITSDQRYLVVVGKNLSRSAGKSYLWWLNGVNKGSQVAPTTTKAIKLADGSSAQLIAWDMTASSLDANNTGSRFSICQGWTIFGLTATKSPALIQDIGFYADPSEAENMATAISCRPATVPASALYDMQGRRVAQPRHHGIYIMGGKKVAY